MKAYLVRAGKARHLLCGDCVKQMVADILGELRGFSVDEVGASDLALLKFPSCDACEASFVGLIEKVEASQ